MKKFIGLMILVGGLFLGARQVEALWPWPFPIISIAPPPTNTPTPTPTTGIKWKVPPLKILPLSTSTPTPAPTNTPPPTGGPTNTPTQAPNAPTETPAPNPTATPKPTEKEEGATPVVATAGESTASEPAEGGRTQLFMLIAIGLLGLIVLVQAWPKIKSWLHQKTG